MRKTVFAIALLAVSSSGVAMAEDTRTKQLKDSEMDEVTAGAHIDTNTRNVYPNWTYQGYSHAGADGFQGQYHSGHAARCVNC
jgi:hypothetical protein